MRLITMIALLLPILLAHHGSHGIPTPTEKLVLTAKHAIGKD